MIMRGESPPCCPRVTAWPALPLASTLTYHVVYHVTYHGARAHDPEYASVRACAGGGAQQQGPAGGARGGGGCCAYAHMLVLDQRPCASESRRVKLATCLYISAVFHVCRPGAKNTGKRGQTREIKRTTSCGPSLRFQNTK